MTKNTRRDIQNIYIHLKLDLPVGVEILVSEEYFNLSTWNFTNKCDRSCHYPLFLPVFFDCDIISSDVPSHLIKQLTTWMQQVEQEHLTFPMLICDTISL